MIGFADAVQAVQACAPTPGFESRPLAEAVGRILAAEVRVRSALPTARSAAMDGYACRAADVAEASASEPVRLDVIDASQAGVPASRTVGPGEAVLVSTGAVVPAGADALVVAEHARQEGERIVVLAPAQAKHIRPVGEDLEQGVVVLSPGTVLGPRDVALAASAGHETLRVARPPNVVVLATGPELRSPASDLGPGEVPDANAPLVVSTLRAHGVRVTVGARALDDEASLEAALDDVLQRAADAGAPADLIVTTGGASIGRHDVVRRQLVGEGDVAFDGIRVRPGRPALLGRRGGLPWLALPGTPHAVAVLGSVLLGAWSNAARGRVRGGDPLGRSVAVLDAPVRSVPNRTVLQLASIDVDDRAVRRTAPLARSESSRMRDVARADGLIVVPEGRDLAVGEVVETILFATG